MSLNNSYEDFPYIADNRPIKIDENSLPQTVSVNIETIRKDLSCPICLEIMKNPVIVKECLHRFCNECIQTCLRKTKMECPACRSHLSSRRDLHPDERMANLINILLPGGLEYEPTAAYVNTVTHHLSSPLDEKGHHRKQKYPQYVAPYSPSNSPKDNDSPTGSPINSNKHTPSSTPTADDFESGDYLFEPIEQKPVPVIKKVTIGLINCPMFKDEYKLNHPYISLSINATVLVLKKYLSQIFNCMESRVNLYHMNHTKNMRPEMECLPSYLTVGQLIDLFCSKNETLILFYSTKSCYVR